MYYESELYHHGIRGQKWGKKNGPPYPLSRKEARQQRKAEKKEIRAKIKKAGARSDEKYSLGDRYTYKPLRETVSKSKELGLSGGQTVRAAGRKYLDSSLHPFKTNKASAILGSTAIAFGTSFTVNYLKNRINNN